MTLSGRHHFTENCKEGEDWCTHCLNPELLAEDSSHYYTVIEQHPVLLDSSYDEWQSKCLWDREVSVFVVREGATLSFEDSVIADVRYKMSSFAFLENSSLRLIRSQLLRLDPRFAFFYSQYSYSFISIEDCYVAGLNRDHVYNPEAASDGGFLTFFGTAGVSIVRSTFTELIRQSQVKEDAMIESIVDFYLVTDTIFTRCIGNLILLATFSNTHKSLRNVTVERNYAEYVIVGMYIYNGAVSLLDCKFTENLSWDVIMEAQVTEVISGVFRNNKHLGGSFATVFYFMNINDLPVLLENTVFDSNTALDSNFQQYWSDYYLAQGLLTDTSLSAEKETAFYTSICNTAALFKLNGALEMTNMTFTDTMLACKYLNVIFLYSANSSILLSDAQINTPASVAIYIHSYEDSIVRIQNSLFESATTLLEADGLIDMRVTNVTFQHAPDGGAQSSPVLLSLFSSSFSNCHWKHNHGRQAGALKVVGSLEIQASTFLNNSGLKGPGDISFSAQNGTLHISSCTFTASSSSLSAASILILGVILQSNVSDCTFTEFLSASVSIMNVAHDSGSLLLGNLTFLKIHSPSAILILISVPLAEDSPATNIIKLQVRDCSFYRGIATDRGTPIVQNVQGDFTGNNGTVIWIQAGQFMDLNSVFAYNTGDILCTFSSGTVSSLKYSQFTENYPNEGVVYVEGPNVQVFLQNCKFTNNVAKEASGVVQLLRMAIVFFENCQFIGNQARSSVIFAQSSTLSLQYCSVSESHDLLNLEDSTAKIISSTFNNLNSTAGMFSLVRSTFELQNSKFSHIEGSGSCLLSAQTCTISFTSVVIQGLECKEEAIMLLTSHFSLLRVDMNTISCYPAAVISSVSAEISMIDVIVTQSSSQFLKALSCDLFLSHCNFTRVQTQQEVGILSCADCSLFVVENTTMQHLEAKSIGAILVSATNVTIRNSNFSHVSARDTGAIRVKADIFELLNSNFFNICATEPGSSGGALSLSGGSLKVTGSNFEASRAWIGGAVYWVSGTLTEQNNSFRENIAAFYGPNWASFSSALTTNSPFVYLHRERKLVVYLLDHFGQVVLTDSSSRATLSTSQSTVLSGQLQTVASSGILIFSEFSTFADPGSNFTVTVTANDLSLNIIFVQRVCELGEINSNKTCKRCHTGTYSLILNGTECKLCPIGVECRNGHHLFPKPSYWRPHSNFPGVFSCPWPESCAGHQNFSSQTGVCAQFYTGPLCQTCEKDAHRRGRDRCTSCESGTSLWLQASFIGLGLPILWGIQAFASSRDNSRLEVLLRLLVDYAQLMVLVIDYDLLWPTSLEYFYNLYHYLGNALQVFLPLDCFYSDAFYISIVAAALAPITIVIVLLAIWGVLLLIFKAIKYTVTTLQVILVNVIIAGLAYAYPFIVRVTFSAFLCQTIEPGEQWVRAALAVRCWDKQHLKFTLGASLPSLLIWGVGLPALACLYLVREKKSREKPRHAEFVWRGFKEKLSLWEVGVMLCKALVAVAYVFTARMVSTVQALVLIAVLSLVLLCQRMYHPYQETVCNRVALISLGTVWMTAYAGLYFSSSGTNLLLLILVYCAHAWFFLSWIATLCGTRFPSFLWVMCLRLK